MSGSEKGAGQLMDFTRMGAIILLLLHFYYYCHALFSDWHLAPDLADRLLLHLVQSGLFSSAWQSKLLAFCLLVISMLGNRGRKEEKLRAATLLFYLMAGLLLYFGSTLLLDWKGDPRRTGIVYMSLSGCGFLLLLCGGAWLSRLMAFRWKNDIFNELNETFPQEERLILNEYSVNLPARYALKGKTRRSFINIVNPFRGLLVVGSPGAGKSWFVIQHVIRQHILKGFGLFVYDFKYDDLSRIAYNCLLMSRHQYRRPPSFHVINFDNLSQSHRCNPLDPSRMNDITDASESARTILLGLNREWINKQGDFFVESPINFVTAVIWFLRKYEEGRFCTLPHVIELMQAPYDQLFPVLNTEPEIEVLVNPFITAYQNDAMEQLEGQTASAKIGMARLSSPQLYWVLSGNDFTLDINDPRHPKIVCMGNNPEKQQIYGAVLSLYVSRLVRQVNKKGMLKCSLIFDEFPTIFFNHIDSLIATARSNKVATTLGIQDFSQLKKDYGRHQAEVIMNITGNIISGQVMGDTAKQLSERFGRIVQERESISINRTDTSVSRSRYLDYAIPPSRISSLSSGEFVGMIADDAHEKIRLKMFHAEIINDEVGLNAEIKQFKDIPAVSNVTQQQVMDNFHQVKLDVKRIIAGVSARLRAGH